MEVLWRGGQTPPGFGWRVRVRTVLDKADLSDRWVFGSLAPATGVLGLIGGPDPVGASGVPCYLSPQCSPSVCPFLSSPTVTGTPQTIDSYSIPSTTPTHNVPSDLHKLRFTRPDDIFLQNR